MSDAAKQIPAGLAECPVCNNQESLKDRCTLCKGAGYISRQRRNAYKAGGRER